MSKKIYINPHSYLSAKNSRLWSKFLLARAPARPARLVFRACEKWVRWSGLQACTAAEIQHCFSSILPASSPSAEAQKSSLDTSTTHWWWFIHGPWSMINHDHCNCFNSKLFTNASPIYAHLVFSLQGLSSWPKSSQRPEWRWHPYLEWRKILIGSTSAEHLESDLKETIGSNDVHHFLISWLLP